MKLKFNVRKALVGLAAGAMVAAGLTALAPAANADGPSACVGTYTIVAGGAYVDFQGGINTVQRSEYLTGHARVVYNTLDPRAGVAEVDRLVREHDAACPSDQKLLLGHSEGAAIIHAWAGATPGFHNVSLVLTGDPKRVGYGERGGNHGISDIGGFLGWPLGGVDTNFGGYPTLEVCHVRDVVCSNNWDWSGYFGGDHGRYDMNAFNYTPGAHGMVWIG